VTVPDIRFPILPRPLRQLLGPLSTPAAGMATQQRFLDVIAANIANAATTRTPEGGPYRRQVAVVQPDPAAGQPAVQVMQDSRPGQLIYDPGHPDANADGFVEYPNVDVTAELVDLMIARRVHEANATVFQAAKAMLRRALEI
jgi:flagellar basal-body rod protein FlgC